MMANYECSKYSGYSVFRLALFFLVFLFIFFFFFTFYTYAYNKDPDQPMNALNEIAVHLVSLDTAEYICVQWSS